MNIVNCSVDYNGDRAGRTNDLISTKGWRYRSVTHFRVRVDLNVHEYILSFLKAIPGYFQVTRRRQPYRAFRLLCMVIACGMLSCF